MCKEAAVDVDDAINGGKIHLSKMLKNPTPKDMETYYPWRNENNIDSFDSR